MKYSGNTAGIVFIVKYFGLKTHYKRSYTVYMRFDNRVSQNYIEVTAMKGMM